MYAPLLRNASVTLWVLIWAAVASATHTVPGFSFEIDDFELAIIGGPTLHEDFEPYPEQTVLISDPNDSTDIALTDPNGRTFATASEGLTSAHGIVELGPGDRVWFIDTRSGVPEEDFFLGIGDLPGFGLGGQFVGDFAVLMNPSERPDLSGGFSLSARVRERTGGAPTRVRFLLVSFESEGGFEAEWVTKSFPLFPNFQTFRVTLEDFMPFPDEPGVLDFSNIVVVSIEFVVPDQGQCLIGDADANQQFNITDVTILRRILAGARIPQSP